MRNDITRAAERAAAEIDRLDLEPIKFKVSSPDDGYGWTEEHVQRIELAYRRFLKLLAFHPGTQLAPTQDIDKFWHAHILDTRKYAADCDRIFGRFLHHYPYLGMLGDSDKQTLAADSLSMLYEREFGEPMPDNAPKAAWCGAAMPEKQAAWCGAATPEKQAAWCGAATPEKQAAWCGAATPEKQAAWCGAATPEKQAAWCGAATPEKKAAWCGAATPDRQAAWCGAETVAEQAAWCGAEVTGQQAAWCGAEAAIEPKVVAAWCGAETTLN
jgi:hypothetical protein